MGLELVTLGSQPSSRVQLGISSSPSRSSLLSRDTEVTALRGAKADHEAPEWVAEVRKDPSIRFRKRLASASTPQRPWAELDPAQETAAQLVPKATDPTPTPPDAAGPALKSPSPH